MDHQSLHFKKLLDKLQQESWQLELIISGFSIYGLFLCIEPIKVKIIESVAKGQNVSSFLLEVLYSSVFVLLTVLLIHVILRGLWIGSLGLRYVSGEVDYDSLEYSEKFTNFLKEKSGSFDRYIARLENICSTLFALAFLMVFYLLSYFLIFGVIPIIVVYTFTQTGWFEESLGRTLSIIFVISYLLISLILFIDFLGMGILKRNKTIAKIYFPLYRIFGYLTLSFLYRPLIYNFLDQKKTRWLATYILPVYLIIMGLIGYFGDRDSNYILSFPESSTTYKHSGNYENHMIDEFDFVKVASISSEIVEKPYVKLFLLFKNEMEDAVFEKDTSLIPEKDRRGFGLLPQQTESSSGTVSINMSWDEADTKKYLRAINDLHRVRIDNKAYVKDFLLTTNGKDQLGFETYLDLEGLPKGKHILRIIGPRKEKEEFRTDTLVTIPFWYYPGFEKPIPENLESALE